MDILQQDIMYLTGVGPHRKEILKIFKQVFVKRDLHMALNLLITSIPAGIIGLLLRSHKDLSHFGA